jgi:predicted patatin/cPLA2 family phospholipase
MVFEGSHAVIKAIQEKRKLIKAGKSHSHIRPLLIQGGGLMRGAYGVGAALALEEMGYNNAFTFMVGISSGAPITAHFAAGSTKKSLMPLLEDCCDKSFVNPWRFWNQVNTKKIIDAMQTNPIKKIDVEKVFANETELYFGVAEYQTAKPKIIKPKNEEHLFKTMHASINMQNVSPYKVIIDGVHYADGGFSSPHVITEALDKLDPTHVLIITNNDREFTPISRIERLLNRTVYRLRLNGILAQAINTRRVARDKAISEAMSGPLPVAVVWGDESISGLEKNISKIEATVEASRTWWHGLYSLEN